MTKVLSTLIEQQVRFPVSTRYLTYRLQVPGDPVTYETPKSHADTNI